MHSCSRYYPFNQIKFKKELNTMPYIEEICEAGLTIEVQKYYTYRYHSKGIPRSPNMDKTSETVKKINQRRAATRLRRLMNANYKDGDFLVRLDFSKDRPKDSEDMQRIIATELRRLKRIYQKDGNSLKYIYTKEVGPRGGRHIHMLINKTDTDNLVKWWKHGGIHIDPLHSGGQYKLIADYFIKYALITENTEGQLVGKRWYASRNLIEPKIRKRVIKAATFKQRIKKKDGYNLDKNSVHYGISEETGYEYFTYTLVRREGLSDDS